MRNIVMSDTGGWLPQLLNTFDMLGINAEESTMPKNLRVIHCGDLIHKGPFSSQLLAIVTGLMVKNPGQWIQLMGNHEAQHVPGAPRFWSCDCSSTDVGLLNLLRQEGLMTPTYALSEKSSVFTLTDAEEVTTPEVNILFSHGGLTEGFWEWKTEGKEDPLAVANLLNELPINEVTAPGLMLGENVPPRQVGPVWAIGNTEVFDSWRAKGETMPFSQFHGHTTSYSFDWKRWWPGLEEFRKTAKLLPNKRAVVSELNNNLMLGVDPGFNEREPRISYQPWLEFTTVN